MLLIKLRLGDCQLLTGVAGQGGGIEQIGEVLKIRRRDAPLRVSPEAVKRLQQDGGRLSAACR